MKPSTLSKAELQSKALFFFFFAQTKTVTDIQSTDCNFLTGSTFIVPDKEDGKGVFKKSNLNEGVIQHWLNQLSNATLCQILSSAISDHPQLTDTIRRSYFGNKDKEGWVPKLSSLNQRAHTISHSLDCCRISDQFSRASEVAMSLHLLLCQFTQDVSIHGPSHVALLGLVLIAQQSLDTPAEVRQHIFSHEKFGRVVILEMASVLKKFKLPLLPHSDWHRINSQQKHQHSNWLITLEAVCLKLARYDVTWEYRKEYQDVPIIAARYYKHQDIYS
ncbi:hypothetical protein BY458DRAFT_539497 [Sporodiniella umbellata]|nr:hypothetical protein BY458DRAFT_539497 [Sporodiniella umbellata]